MIIINTDKAFINAENLKKKYSSTGILVDSFSILKIKKSNVLRKLLFIMVEIIVSVIMATQVNTIVLTKDVFELIISIIIALLAMVFTGYAFFQALINNKLLIALLSVDETHDGNLSQTNKYFAEVMAFQVLCLLSDLVIIVITIILPEEWSWFDVNLINEVLATIGIFVGLHVNIEAIWEMKSFIFNVFQLFNLHAYSRMAEIKDQEKTL